MTPDWRGGLQCVGAITVFLLASGILLTLVVFIGGFYDKYASYRKDERLGKENLDLLDRVARLTSELEDLKSQQPRPPYR